MRTTSPEDPQPPSPSPTPPSTTAALMTGQVVHLRLAAPTDLEAVRDFYAHLDDDATYHRFFAVRRHIPDDELRTVVSAASTHVTMLATLDGQLIGIGEYIVDGTPTDAEVAFAVADDHHREGVATLLLERLAMVAHARGLRRFTAMVMRDNQDMLLVFRTVGLTATTQVEDDVMHVTLDLTSVVELQAAAARRRLS